MFVFQRMVSEEEGISNVGNKDNKWIPNAVTSTRFQQQTG